MTSGSLNPLAHDAAIPHTRRVHRQLSHLGALEAEQDVRDVFDDVVWRHRGKKIAPKTLNRNATWMRSATPP